VCLGTINIERYPCIHQLNYSVYREAVSHPQSEDSSCRKVGDLQNISVYCRSAHRLLSVIRLSLRNEIVNRSLPRIFYNYPLLDIA